MSWSGVCDLHARTVHIVRRGIHVRDESPGCAPSSDTRRRSPRAASRDARHRAAAAAKRRARSARASSRRSASRSRCCRRAFRCGESGPKRTAPRPRAIRGSRRRVRRTHRKAMRRRRSASANRRARRAPFGSVERGNHVRESRFASDPEPTSVAPATSTLRYPRAAAARALPNPARSQPVLALRSQVADGIARSRSRSVSLALTMRVPSLATPGLAVGGACRSAFDSPADDGVTMHGTGCPRSHRRLASHGLPAFCTDRKAQTSRSCRIRIGACDSIIAGAPDAAPVALSALDGEHAPFP